MKLATLVYSSSQIIISLSGNSNMYKIVYRMIRQSEGPTAIGAGEKSEEKVELRSQANKDSALWAPTGWVHVEKDIDFSDPKVRPLY